MVWTSGTLTVACKTSDRLPTQSLMLGNEKSEIAADEVAVEAGLVDLKREAFAKVEAMANATACRRRQVAVQDHHPLKDLILMPAPALPQFTNDLVEVPSLDAAIVDRPRLRI